MQIMLFGTPPEFQDILNELRKLEAEIKRPLNKMSWEAHDSAKRQRC